MAMMQWIIGGMVAMVVGFAVVMSHVAAQLEPLVAPGDWIARKIYLASGTTWPNARLGGTALWWFVMGILAVWLVQTLRDRASTDHAARRGRPASAWQ